MADERRRFFRVVARLLADTGARMQQFEGDVVRLTIGDDHEIAVFCAGTNTPEILRERLQRYVDTRASRRTSVVVVGDDAGAREAAWAALPALQLRRIVEAFVVDPTGTSAEPPRALRSVIGRALLERDADDTMPIRIT